MIKGFEGLALEARRLPDGRHIIGHGHTETAREGARLSAEQAEALLIWDLRPIEEALNASVFSPLSQTQFDALASFALNIGLERFLASDVLRALNAGRPIEAALALDGWRLGRTADGLVTLDALVRRRAAEKALFLAEPSGPSAPAARVQPEFDLRAALDELAAEIAQAEDHVAPPTAPPPSEVERVADSVVERMERLTQRLSPGQKVEPPTPDAPTQPTPEPFTESIETDLGAAFEPPAETRSAMGGLGFYGALAALGALLAGAGLFDAYRMQDVAAPIERAAVGPLLAAAGLVILIGAAWHIARALDTRKSR